MQVQRNLSPVKSLPGGEFAALDEARSAYPVQEHLVFIQPGKGGEKSGDYRERDSKCPQELRDLVMYARLLVRVHMHRVEAEFLVDSASKFVLAQVGFRR